MKQKRYQIIIDVVNIPLKFLEDKITLEDFLRHLTQTIDMNVLAGPIIAKGIPQNPGLSGVVIIDYSHISVHTFEAVNEALVDIFSCKPYDKDKAKQAVLDYFHAKPNDVSIQTVSWG